MQRVQDVSLERLRFEPHVKWRGGESCRESHAYFKILTFK